VSSQGATLQGSRFYVAMTDGRTALSFGGKSIKGVAMGKVSKCHCYITPPSFPLQPSLMTDSYNQSYPIMMLQPATVNASLILVALHSGTK
jgi:hypothetical protein